MAYLPIFGGIPVVLFVKFKILLQFIAVRTFQAGGDTSYTALPHAMRYAPEAALGSEASREARTEWSRRALAPAVAV